MQNTSDRILGFVMKHYRENALDTLKASSPYVHRQSFRIWRYVAATAAAAAVIAGVFLFRGKPSYEYFAAGDTLAVAQLKDGSSVTLSPGSSLRYSQGKKSRNVDLKGTAYFSVKHDAKSPFTVSVAGAEVKVLGTVFQVKQSSDGVSVNVMEGKVLFTGEESGNGPVLTAGMESFLEKGAESPVVLDTPTPNPTAWLTGEFRYDAIPLETVLSELSEYFGKEISAAPVYLQKPLTGVFLSDDLDSIVDAIESALEVKITVK